MPTETRILGGKYALVAPAGVGGMGTVWRGVLHGDDGFTRTVAIKRLHHWVAEQADGVARFIQEAHIASELCHPHIVQALDFQKDPKDSRYVIVMEWVEGLDLGRYLRTCFEQQQTPPWEVLVGIVIEVLSALAAAHDRVGDDGTRAPVFHGDVSPSNVLVSVGGVAKLTDFGLAHAVDRVTSTQPAVLRGKLAYMAPEYMLNGQATAASDLFAVGLMLWEGLAGRRLAADRQEAGTSATPDFSDEHQGIPALDAIRSDLPPDLATVVAQAVALDPAARFASAIEMQQALRDIVRPANIDTTRARVGRSIQALQPLVDRSQDAPVEESGEYLPKGTLPPG